MRLGDFILSNLEPILAEWENFARRVWSDGPIDPAELRDHALQILRVIALDMKTSQSAAQQMEKSRGATDTNQQSGPVIGAAHMHAAERRETGFDLMAIVAEYRALRSSVVRLWRHSNPQPDQNDLADLTRFDESLDQLIAGAVTGFTHTASRAQQLLLAIVAHDLRNPLASMKLIGHLIAHSGQLDQELTEMAAQIPTTADAMSKLIDDLRDFSATHLTGVLPVTPAPMDLGTICEQVVAELRAAHPDRTVHLERRGDLTGTWDEMRLRQVVSNLLGNAIQHGGNATAPVELSVIGEGPQVVLGVHNQGNPIPHEALPTIFDPLVRGQQTTQQHGSMGLGLYISRAVVVAHGGTIDVTSSKKAGTTVTVRLPRIWKP